MVNTQNLCVISGGPGVGKTSLLSEMKNRGYHCIPEDARNIIKSQVDTGGEGLPWKNKSMYARLMIDASVSVYQKLISEMNERPVFFDRGILDAIAYMQMENIRIDPQLDKIARSHRYADKVFVLPPWQQIYTTDDERKQNWDEAVETFAAIKRTYLHYNYEVIEVPKGSVSMRADFVLEYSVL